MSPIPQEIPDFGSAQLAPRQNPQFSPGADFTTEDYFVWSRLDGRTTLRDVILMVGLGIEKAIAILRRLRQSGAVLLPGERPSDVKIAPAAPAPAQTAPDADIDLGALTPEEERAMAEAVQLQEREKRRIIQLMRLVAGSDYFAVLGVARAADRRELKRAYFRLSKEFHPDRHYNQELGSFGPWLSRIFETATRAWQLLSDDTRRGEYVAQLDAGGGQVMAMVGVDGTGPVISGRSMVAQGRSQHAAELYTRACDMEVGGDRHGALTLFRAAIRVDGQPRYLRRAAACALAAGELGEAEVYARKAVSLRADDASYARVLADVLRGCGRLEEAEEVLVRALDLRSSRDALARELEGDLARVRAARRATGPGT